MENIIVTTPAELRAIIADEVAKVIPGLADFRRRNEAVEVDSMNVDAAVDFLESQGYPTTASSLYNSIFKNTIPYKKIGRRVVFSRHALTRWLDENTITPDHYREAAALRIAKSACKKRR